MDAHRFTERGGLPVLELPVLDGLPVDAVVTTVAGGASTGPYASLNLGLHVGDEPAAVIENRRRSVGALGATLDDLVVCNQVHGDSIVEVGHGDRGRGAWSMDDVLADADAMVTTVPGPVLAVLAADCVPLLLCHRAGVLACVHAGWKGTTARIAAAAVEAMGVPAGEVVAAIGPAVEVERYQVGPEVAAAVEACFGEDVGDVLVPDAEPDRWRFDLRAANRRVLVEVGVDPDRIASAGVGTGDERFFSDRRARPCGRIGLLARLVA